MNIVTVVRNAPPNDMNDATVTLPLTTENITKFVSRN